MTQDPAVPVPEDQPNEPRTEQPEPSPRGELEAIREPARVLTHRLDDPLVLPLWRAEQPRPLQEPAARFEFGDGQVVIVDRQNPEQPQPTAPDRPAHRK